MLTTRRPVRSLPFRSTPVTPLEPRFPRALAGEEFERYAKSKWAHARRWMDSHWVRAVRPEASMHGARESFRVLLAMELGRRPRPQEEQLLGAVLHDTWPAHGGELPDILPYWSHIDPLGPRPAA